MVSCYGKFHLIFNKTLARDCDSHRVITLPVLAELSLEYTIDPMLHIIQLTLFGEICLRNSHLDIRYIYSQFIINHSGTLT